MLFRSRERRLVEKYDADGALQGGGGGEYPLQDGFGWTNGVVLALLALYPELETAASPAHATAPPLQAPRTRRPGWRTPSPRSTATRIDPSARNAGDMPASSAQERAR